MSPPPKHFLPSPKLQSEFCVQNERNILAHFKLLDVYADLEQTCDAAKAVPHYIRLWEDNENFS